MTRSKSLRDKLREDAARARRKMVTDGVFITGHELCARLQIDEEHLRKLAEDGSVFSMTVEGNSYYPAFLADPRFDHLRLREICRLIGPAPPDARFDFLTSTHGSLGDRQPLDLLQDDSDYTVLRKNAAEWVAQWSRTTVALYEGEYEAKPDNVEPLYTAMTEIDPRRSILDRALTALAAHEYEFPLGPYPEAKAFTAFVERQDSSDIESRPEACLQIFVDGERVRIRTIFKEGATRLSHTVPAGKVRNVVAVAKQVLAYLLRR